MFTTLFTSGLTICFIVLPLIILGINQFEKEKFN